MGIGLGTGYLSPVKTLMLWFEDKKGLATGLAVAGFGLAKAIASPIMHRPPFFFGFKVQSRILTVNAKLKCSLFEQMNFSVFFISDLFLQPPDQDAAERNFFLVVKNFS